MCSFPSVAFFTLPSRHSISKQWTDQLLFVFFALSSSLPNIIIKWSAVCSIHNNWPFIKPKDGSSVFIFLFGCEYMDYIAHATKSALATFICQSRMFRRLTAQIRIKKKEENSIKSTLDLTFLFSIDSDVLQYIRTRLFVRRGCVLVNFSLV